MSLGRGPAGVTGLGFVRDEKGGLLGTEFHTRSGLLTSERFSMAEGSHTLRVPIRDEFIPNLHVQVDLAGSAPRTNDQGEEMPDVPP